MKIKCIQSSWSGWSPNYKPKEVEYEFDVKKGDECIVKYIKIYEDGEYKKEIDFSFDIISINNDSVEIKTNKSMSEGKQGINMMKRTQKFKITKDKQLYLKTQTFDMGDTFVFKLID